MKAWQIDDRTAYKYVCAVQKAIKDYFEKRNSELSDRDKTETIIRNCENTHAWKAVTEILNGNVDITEQGD